jgi:outer membrane protein assembly factor BamE (lipoprotein component of BamABCDE complex)
MWINLEPDESVVNLDLDYFNDFDNPNWEYIFWSESNKDNSSEELAEQSLLYSDSIANAHDSVKRSKNIPIKKQISRNFNKRDTQKSELSNFVQDSNEHPISRNLTILKRNFSKKSSHNYLSSQSIKDEDISKVGNEEVKRVKNMSQSSLNGNSNNKPKTFSGKTKNIARVLHDTQKKDISKISKSVNELVFLMENPQSWVSKLEIDYKDYIRGNN